MIKNRLLIVFLSYLFYFIVFVLFVQISKFFLNEKPKNIYYSVIVSIISTALMIYFLVKMLKLNIWDKIKLDIRTVFSLILLSAILVLIYPITIPVNFTKYVLNDLLLVSKFNPFYNLLSVNFLYYISLVVLVGPIFEELFFRRIILTEINKKYGFFWAIFISSLLFGLIHLDVKQSQSAFFIGFILGYLYLKTNNIAIPILLHMLLNLMTYFTRDSTLQLSTNYYWFLLYTVLAIVIYFLIKLIMKTNPKEILQN